MKHRFRSLSLALLLTLAALVVAPQQAMAAERWTCGSGSDAGRWDPGLASTSANVSLYGRNIELRYHSSARCSWGRISNGSPGDSVWVDWSENGGRDWRQLSVTRIPSRGTQVYTSAHAKGGFTMRACGKAGNRAEVVCTRWV